MNVFRRSSTALIVRMTMGMVMAMAMCSFAVADDVKTDFDKKADFSQYRTYEWGTVQTSNPLWQQRVMDAVDKDLQAKGWQKVPSGGDVTVMAVGSTRNQQEYQTFYTGIGPRWRWRGFGDEEATTTVQNYQVGTLVVDLYDARSNRLIFRGTATDTLSDKPEKNEKKLEKAVDKMFDKFPPQGKQ